MDPQRRKSPQMPSRYTRGEKVLEALSGSDVIPFILDLLKLP